MSQEPLRVLVIVFQKNANWPKAWDSTADLIPVALQVLEDKQLLKDSHNLQSNLVLLSKHKWQTRVMFVFDISNTAYDTEKGHLPEQNQLPVVVVSLGRTATAYEANNMVRERVNNSIAEAHNLNGINGCPPFLEDHTTGSPPLYLNPRDPSLL